MGSNSDMRIRLPAALVALLLASSLLPPLAHSQPRPPEPGEDFPLEDYSVWVFIRHGLNNKAADLQLQRAPESPETVARLLEAYRPGEALTVIRLIVDRRPEHIGAAFKAAAAYAHQLNDEGRGYRSRLRDTVARARERLRELPREQAAEAAWHVRSIDFPAPGEIRPPWPEQVRDFATEYSGTGAALAAQLSILGEDGDIHSRIAALEAFARAHRGTVVGAQALYAAAEHLRNNAREPRGADPTERLLRVAALARELQGGAYPDCEWVREAPQLVVGFSAEPQYASANMPRVLALFREFLLKGFDVLAVNPLGGRSGYFISHKLPAIFAAGGGDPVREIEQFLVDLERDVYEPAAVRYLRGLWYQSLSEEAKDVKVTAEWRRKADATLLDVGRAGAGLYHRKALASAASIKFKEKSCAAAIERYREYLTRFPHSEWAWVATLRLGQCQQRLGNWLEARQAYESVTSTPAAMPPALVFGHTFAGRASEALDDWKRARTAYASAERAWEQHFADPYFGTYQFHTRLDDEPCDACDPRSTSDVSREWLRHRVAELDESFGLPGGALLERGKFLMTQGAWQSAMAPLDGFIRRHPDSPRAAQARELVVRAKFEMALQQGGPEAGEQGKRAALEVLDGVAAGPYGFSVFAAHVARATLYSMTGSSSRATEAMSEALARWHEHGAALFAGRPATALQQDVMEIRDVVFQPNEHSQHGEFRHLRSSDSPPPYFVVTPEVRVTLHDDSRVRVEAASRLCTRPGALLLDDEQLSVLERILRGLGGTKRGVPQSIMATPNQPAGDVEHILKFWNRFFTMGPGHWGGWILQTFPIVNRITFIDPARSRGGAEIRTGYRGSTQLLAKEGGTWKVTGSSGHWIE